MSDMPINNNLDSILSRDQQEEMFDDWWGVWYDLNDIDREGDVTKTVQNKRYKLRQMKKMKEYSADIMFYAHIWECKKDAALRHEKTSREHRETIRDLKAQLSAQKTLLDTMAPAPAPVPFEHPEPEPQENFNLPLRSCDTDDYSFLDDSEEDEEQHMGAEQKRPLPKRPLPPITLTPDDDDDIYGDSTSYVSKYVSPEERAQKELERYAKEHPDFNPNAVDDPYD